MSVYERMILYFTFGVALASLGSCDTPSQTPVERCMEVYKDKTTWGKPGPTLKEFCKCKVKIPNHEDPSFEKRLEIIAECISKQWKDTGGE